MNSFEFAVGKSHRLHADPHFSCLLPWHYLNPFRSIQDIIDDHSFFCVSKSMPGAFRGRFRTPLERAVFVFA